MKSDLLKTLIVNQGTVISLDVMESWTTPQLKMVSTWLGMANISEEDKKKHQDFLASLKPFIPVSDATKQNAQIALRGRALGTTIEVGNPEGAVWRKGGDVFYTKDEMIVRRGNGQVVSVPNRIIPIMKPVQRPGVQSLAVLLSTFVKIQRGQVKDAVAADKFALRWDTSTVFNYENVAVLASIFRQAFNVDPVCAPLRGEETRTKEAIVRELINILSTMDESLYYYMHTQVVFDFLMPFLQTRKTTKSGRMVWSRKLVVDDDGKPAIPESSYACVTDDKLSEVLKLCQKSGYHSVAIYKGGLPRTIKVIGGTGIAGALSARQIANETRGSEKTGGSFLSAHVGYSGLSTEAVRTLQRGMAMVGGVFLSWTGMVDIYPGSLGNIDILYSSIKHHFKERDNWRFVIDMSQSINLKPLYKDWAVTQPRVGAHCVIFVPLPITTQKAMTVKVSDSDIREILKNYTSRSHSWNIGNYDNYTIYSAMYGYYPWAKPEVEEENTAQSSAVISTEKRRTVVTTSPLTRSKSFDDRYVPAKEHFVYKFSWADQFYGICSTIKDFSLFGCRVALETKEHGTKKIQDLVVTPTRVFLPVILSEEDWYKNVRLDNARRETYWMTAVKQFSEISNVLKVPKSGATLSYDEDLGEMALVAQDLYEIAEVPNRRGLKRFDDEDDNDYDYDDEDEDDDDLQEDDNEEVDEDEEVYEDEDDAYIEEEEEEVKEEKKKPPPKKKVAEEVKKKPPAKKPQVKATAPAPEAKSQTLDEVDGD